MSAVFKLEKSKVDDPFYVAPEPRTFYHPTLPKTLSKKTKNIALSPERLNSHLKGSIQQQDVKGNELSPGEKGFLSGSNAILAKELPTHDTPSPGPADTSSKFDESWPASERPSTIESPGEVQNVSSSSAASRQSIGPASSGPLVSIMEQKSREESQQEAESTLGRLIDRFRHSAPQSREERARQSASGSKDFWWLSSSSSSPPHPPPSSSHAPTETTPSRGTGPSGGARGVGGPRRGTGVGRARGRGASRIPSWSGFSRSGVSSLSSGQKVSGISTLASSSCSSLKTSSSATDRVTDEIQRRAEKLLEISESTILSEPGVSSDGVGSFTTSSPITDDNTPPRDDAYLSRLNDKENLPRPPLFPANLSYTQRPQGPAEDILQQWRMRRRMEQAKEGALQRVSGRVTQRPLRQAQGENTDVRRDEADRNDADSKLTEFRRRLQQQKLLTEARMASSTQHAPVKDNPTTHVGTNPIPQSIATQTGRQPVSCVETGDRSRLGDRTRNVQQEGLMRKDSMQQLEPPGRGGYGYPVASQNISGHRNQFGHEVETGSVSRPAARTASVKQEEPSRRDTTQHDSVQRSGLAEYPVESQNIYSIRSQRGQNFETGNTSNPAARTAYVRQEELLRRETIQQEDSVYPIASPNVPGTQNQNEHVAGHLHDVPPHLHLSCDILPCGKSGPHVHTVTDLQGRTEFAGHPERHHHSTGDENVHGYGEDCYGRAGESGRNLAENGLHSQRVSHDKDQKTQKHNQMPPHSSRVSQSDVHHRDAVPYEDQSMQSKGQSSSRISKMSNFVLHRKKASHDEGQRTKMEGQIAPHISKISHHGPHKETAPHCDYQRIQTGKQTENETRPNQKATQHHQRLPTRTKPQDHSQDGSINVSSHDVQGANPRGSRLQRSDDIDDDGAKRQLDFGPSSPNTINNAIGQVISNRMFSSPLGQRSIPASQRSSPGSVRSSALSDDTLMFTPPRSDPCPSSHREERDNSKAPLHTVIVDSESRSSSDSEEFQDDEMLRVLRRQREQCIKQLNHLDSLLSHTSRD